MSDGGAGASAGGRGRARAHQRVRDAHATELAEDYVEAIAARVGERGVCRVKDLASRFGVSHVTVIRTLSRLSERGLVKTAKHRPVELTAAGRRLAELSAHRHGVVLSFLRSIGVSEGTAQADAEGIEHHVSPETLGCLERFVADRGGAGS